MKVGNNKYKCGFCGKVIIQEVNKRYGQGRKGVATDQIKCECGNYVSQKENAN